MGLKSRYRLGFAFGKFEHQTRELGYLLLVIGVAFLGCGLFAHWRWMQLASLAAIGEALFLETISYIAHRLEKKTMDKIRFGKN